MSLEVGNIVTVVSEDCRFFESQGEIVEIKDDGDPDGNIGVRFGEWYADLFDYPDGKYTIVRFVEKELRQDADWSLEAKIVRLYGKHCWHSVYVLKKPFDPTEECPEEGCAEQVSRRCLINIWGSIYEIDLCGKHVEKYHGKCGEIFPAKQVAHAPGI